MSSREQPVERVPPPHPWVVGRQYHRQDQDGNAAGIELHKEVPLALRPAGGQQQAHASCSVCLAARHVTLAAVLGRTRTYKDTAGSGCIVVAS